MSTLVEMVNFGASLNYTVTACPAPGLTSTSDWVRRVLTVVSISGARSI